MTGKNVVQVKNISSKTEDKEIKDFFAFCGKITDIKVQSEGADNKSATVTFEKDTAAKTALLLNNTQLGANHISVTSDAAHDDSHDGHTGERDSDTITQEEKPRSRIFAEYLAHGYVISDAALQQAINLDQKHGVSSRFLNTLQGLDKKYHATDRAQTVDQSYGITQKATNLLQGIGSYFEKAADTPTGQKIVKFYSDSQRQVTDIHSEARRLADLKKDEHGGSAYKAAGLERVFGKEAPPAASATTADHAATSDSKPAAPADGGVGTDTSAQVPKKA
jgi:hypothetical protein